MSWLKNFFVQNLGDLLETIKKLKNNPEKNKINVNLINSGLRDLKKEIKNISEDEIKNEIPYEIVGIVEKIL